MTEVKSPHCSTPGLLFSPPAKISLGVIYSEKQRTSIAAF